MPNQYTTYHVGTAVKSSSVSLAIFKNEATMELVQCLVQNLKLTYQLSAHLNVQRMNMALNMMPWIWHLSLYHQMYNSEPFDAYTVKNQCAQMSSCIYSNWKHCSSSVQDDLEPITRAWKHIFSHPKNVKRTVAAFSPMVRSVSNTGLHSESDSLPGAPPRGKPACKSVEKDQLN